MWENVLPVARAQAVTVPDQSPLENFALHEHAWMIVQRHLRVLRDEEKRNTQFIFCVKLAFADFGRERREDKVFEGKSFDEAAHTLEGATTAVSLRRVEVRPLHALCQLNQPVL